MLISNKRGLYMFIDTLHILKLYLCNIERILMTTSSLCCLRDQGPIFDKQKLKKLECCLPYKNWLKEKEADFIIRGLK